MFVAAVRNLGVYCFVPYTHCYQAKEILLTYNPLPLQWLLRSLKQNSHFKILPEDLTRLKLLGFFKE
jgi:hypothetical protein